MKQFVIFFVAIVISLNGIKCMLIMGVTQIHKEELAFALETSELHSLKNACVKHDYEIFSEEELYADFLSEFAVMTAGDVSVDIVIYELSLKDGIMDMEVTEKFVVMNETKEISCRRRLHVVYSELA